MSADLGFEVLDLEPIKARRAAISEAPWKVGDPPTAVVSGVAIVEQQHEDRERPWSGDIARCHMTRGHVQSEWRNAEFIAHAPDDVDVLVAEVEKLTAALVAWQATASGLMDASLRGDAIEVAARHYLNVTDDAPSHVDWAEARARLEQAVRGGAS